MTIRSTRLVGFGGGSIRLEYTAGRPAEIVDFLFDSAQAGASGEPCADIELRENPSDGDLELVCAGRIQRKHASAGLIANELLSTATFQLAGAGTNGPVFHAATVTRNGLGLLFPGRSGSGKTTLAAYLAMQGFTYLNDELACVESGALTIEASVRPLSIKAPGIRVLQPYVPMASHQTLSSAKGILLSRSAIHTDPAPAGVVLSAVIFPRYVEGTEFRLLPMSEAQTGLGLMESLLNARNLSGHGFPEVARLARSVRGYSMSFAHLDQVGESLDALESLTARESPHRASANGCPV